ncbi:MAG: protein kinase [Candidatus Korobacteraceae bacterium]
MDDDGTLGRVSEPGISSGAAVGEIVAKNYEILGRVGAGGMGVVYRARDLRLERIVALKFLPLEIAASERDKRHFLNEARTASALDHPNIGVIHGVEETADGRSFIVMAFYEGESLAQRIHRTGALLPSEALDIAAQMACGLGEAHAHHIIHRDIKPSNAMITPQGIVKIVDFGLARAAEQTATGTHGIAGTVDYMSPEQSMGEPVDHRTDLWSLGVVLAQMVTGHNPFHREKASATIFAIMNAAPRRMNDVPLDLQQVIYRALAKEADERYQSATDFLADLDAITAQTRDAAVTTLPRGTRPSSELRRSMERASVSVWQPPAVVKPWWRTWWTPLGAVLLILAGLLAVPAVRERLRSPFAGPPAMHVAVLPFTNLGNDPANDALTDGLMDSLAGELSNLKVGDKSLWVVPTSEVRRLKVTDPSAALSQLGATMVVKGSIARDGQDVRLNVSLIDTKDLRQLGSANFEDRAGDFATLQNEAVSQLARLMNINVTPDMLRNTGGSVMPAAYEQYLSANGYMLRYDKPRNLDLAIKALQKSLAADPRFALGYAQLGEAYRLKYVREQNPALLDEALANCQKAVELDDRIPAVYVTLGYIHNKTGKYDLAVEEFQRALQADPRDSSALMGMAHSYETAGRLADAEAAFQKAADARPDYWDGYEELALFYNRQGKYPQAIAAYKRALEITPDNAQVYLNLGGAYLESGDPKMLSDAEQALTKSLAMNPSYPAYANLGNLYGQEKRYAEAAAMTEKALALDDNDYLVWDNLAAYYKWLNRTDKVLEVRGKMLPLVESKAKANPRDATAQAVLATIYAEKGWKDKALTRIKSAYQLAPDDAEVLQSIADAAEKIGDRKAALEYSNRALQKGATWDSLIGDADLQELLKDPGLHAPVK